MKLYVIEYQGWDERVFWGSGDFGQLSLCKTYATREDAERTITEDLADIDYYGTDCMSVVELKV